ncbi:hypothetical protein IGI04_039827, partial [Brassica rapa subsp. trilocularis]
SFYKFLPKTNDHILHQASREEHQGGFLAVVISRSCPDTKDPQVSFCFKRKSSLTAIFHGAINIYVLSINPSRPSHPLAKLERVT